MESPLICSGLQGLPDTVSTTSIWTTNKDVEARYLNKGQFTLTEMEISSPGNNNVQANDYLSMVHGSAALSPLVKDVKCAHLQT